MLQHHHVAAAALPGEVRNVHLDKPRYGVFTAEGHLLGTFDKREQADSLTRTSAGRYVEEVADLIEVTLR